MWPHSLGWSRERRTGESERGVVAACAEGENGEQLQAGGRLWGGSWSCSIIGSWCWLRSCVNALKVTEFCTLGGGILGFINYASVKLLRNNTPGFKSILAVWLVQVSGWNSRCERLGSPLLRGKSLSCTPETRPAAGVRGEDAACAGAPARSAMGTESGQRRSRQPPGVPNALRVTRTRLTAESHASRQRYNNCNIRTPNSNNPLWKGETI